MTDGTPDPHIPFDVLADLHAGVLADDEAAALWPRVNADPEATAVIEALEATRHQLATSTIQPIAPPPQVCAQIEATLATIAAEVTASSGVADLATHRTRRSGWRHPRALVGAASAAAVLAVVATVAIVAGGGGDSTPTRTAAGPSTTIGADQLPPATALLAVLGRTGGAPFTDQARLRRCLQANGVPDQTPVLGSGPITVRTGPAAVVLLGTGVAGRFDALVVTLDCDTGNPGLLTRTTIGAVIPTR
ncbi:hypothetical protein [Williamsia sp. CHRR-6]|uniref:hypothetical protein n=1 Tax=Williamsia sp. CHRR-6 TaxID=2835871 RepID=UPI001BDAAD89|nr:hypothetical protein [Williamsia sp. CHRR-6]MBT0567751.1 hypothetical protein [Williamsia sp. CHRR-6]